MASLLLLPVPGWPALERAAATFEAALSSHSETALAAALQAFGERAELLTLFVVSVGGRPRLN